MSVAFEAATGADSIPTIEEHYEVDGGYGSERTGVYECPFPGCGFRRRDAEAMWQHVHFGKHRGPGEPTLEQARAKYRAGEYPT